MFQAWAALCSGMCQVSALTIGPCFVAAHVSMSMIHNYKERAPQANFCARTWRTSSS